MAVVTSVPEPNLWNEICREHEKRNPPFTDELESINTDLHDYDPSKHSPVFYGAMHSKVPMDDDAVTTIDPSVSHPAAAGYAFIDRPVKSPPSSPPPLPDHKSCSPRTYLETFIFPTLMPALQDMLVVAKKERCFERKRTRFNALDYLTEKLYHKNPRSEEERNEDGSFLDIDFVKEHLDKHPRAPLPLSLLWTEEEATLVIQSWWRGYVVRREPEVQELREWQKMWREEHADVTTKVSNFWADKIAESTMSEQNEEAHAQKMEEVTENENEVAEQPKSDSPAATVENPELEA